ncbi:hypothetical protein [uncultured Porphyromonas sp.]|uniref:hypothetical protein n=1 Tax=uncultured Porphyromonas sp. TaxID=159274 RepID=UPI00259B9EF0|nr:hypothetical protein [uncultured Porphyromonas sp.]
MSNNILTILKGEFQKLIDKYPWLSIKYEYSQVRGVYLVTYIFNKGTDSQDFIEDTMMFENEINSTFGIKAPLFCDNQELFQLSEKAVTVSQVTSNTSGLVTSSINEVSWYFSEPLDTPIVATVAYSLAA